MKPAVVAIALGSLFLLAACQPVKRTSLQTASYVDVPRFMGRWYVIASIPTRIERDAYNAVESYRLAADGRVLTEFTFREGGFDGRAQRYAPVGFVRDGGNGAVWGMRFVWPIKADYRVMYVDPAYTQTVVGRQKRDYAWIMARMPEISASDYARHVELLRQNGYDVARLRLVPQQPESARGH